jgi:hypothetical protein
MVTMITTITKNARGLRTLVIVVMSRGRALTLVSIVRHYNDGMAKPVFYTKPT